MRDQYDQRRTVEGLGYDNEEVIDKRLGHGSKFYISGSIEVHKMHKDYICYSLFHMSLMLRDRSWSVELIRFTEEFRSM